MEGLLEELLRRVTTQKGDLTAGGLGSKHAQTELAWCNVSGMSVPFQHELLQVCLHELVSLPSVLFACLCLHHTLHEPRLLNVMSLTMRVLASNPSACHHFACSEDIKWHLKLEQLLIKMIDGCWLVCAVHVFGLGELVSWGNSWIMKRSLKFASKAEAPSYANCTYCIKPAEGDS